MFPKSDIPSRLRATLTISLCMAFFLTVAGCEKSTTQTAAAPESAAPQAQPAPTEVSDPIEEAAEVMTEANYRKHIEILASDEFGGRAPASPGEELTVDYLVKKYFVQR